jgi:hypothetical protein
MDLSGVVILPKVYWVPSVIGVQLLRDAKVANLALRDSTAGCWSSADTPD